MGNERELVYDVHETLVALTERSLLVHDSLDGRSWYRMLEPLAMHARSRLEIDERETALDRLADHLAARAEEVLALRTIEDDRHARMLAVGFDGHRAAVEHCIRVGDVDRGHRALAAMWWLEDAGRQAEMIAVARRLARCGAPSAPVATTGITSTLLRVTGRSDLAEEAAMEAVRTGDGWGVAVGHRTLGLIRRAQERWDDALDAFGSGRRAAEGIGAEWLAMEIDMHVGLVASKRGRPDEAVAMLDRLVERAVDQPLVANWARTTLAFVLLGVDPDRAVAIATGLLEDEVTDLWIEASAHEAVGLGAVLVGDLDLARLHFARSLRIFVDIGNRTDVTVVLDGIAVL